MCPWKFMLTSLLADQIIRHEIKQIGIFRNEYTNPPCTSSLAASCIKSAMVNSCDGAKVAAPFTEVVSTSAEGELTIDESASTVSLGPNLCAVPGKTVAVQEREECVGEFFDHLIGEGNAATPLVLGGEVDDNDSFADIMNGFNAVGHAESEGWTFADALARASLSVETLAGGIVDTSYLPTC